MNILPPSATSSLMQLAQKISEIVQAVNFLSTQKLANAHKVITGNSDIASGFDVMPIDSTGGSFNIGLPFTNAMKERIIYLKHIRGSMAGVTITIQAKAGENIDGSSSITITSNYGKIALWSDGENWFSL